MRGVKNLKHSNGSKFLRFLDIDLESGMNHERVRILSRKTNSSGWRGLVLGLDDIEDTCPEVEDDIERTCPGFR